MIFESGFRNRGSYLGFGLNSLLIPVSLAVLLVFISFSNFLLFHTLAELFAIIVATLICVVAWQLYPYTKNHFLMYLGCGYLWVGVLDLAHTLTYKGVSIISVTGANVAVQLWVGTRYIEAFVLLSAPWFLRHRLDRNAGIILFGILAGLLLFAVGYRVFPDGFVEGAGLTRFKVVSEYIIIAMLAASIVYLLHSRDLLEKRILVVIVLSIILTMCAELAFTFYVSVYGISNLVGHIFKLFSFWLIFMAMVRTTLQEPFVAMFRGASTYDAIPDVTIVVNKSGVLQQVNTSACELAGKSRNELTGKHSHDIFHPGGTSIEQCPVCRAVVKGNSLTDMELETSDPEPRWFSYSLSKFIGSADGQMTVEVMRDVTRKRQAEARLSSLDMLKDSIIENLPLMLFVKDAKDLRFVEWNRVAEKLTGLSRDEMIGTGDLEHWPEPEARFFNKKDREVLASGVLLDIPEEPLSTKSGVHTLHTKKIPIFDHEGNASYLLGLSEDITEKKQIQLAMHRSKKMEALGKLTGGIAHDYNNMLGVIMGFSELLQNSLKKDELLSGYVSEIRHAAERGSKLTQKMLSFSRQQATEAAEVDINELIREQQHMLEKTLTVRVELVLDLTADECKAWLNVGELEDSLLNICINAMHAMNGEGRLVIVTRKKTISEREAEQLKIVPGDYVSVSLRDTGCGMSAEIQNSIFDPFYSTRGDQGTGLGLSQVYGFVQRSGGTIKVDSETGNGADFVLYFPLYIPTENEMTDEQGEPESDLKGTETILVVDDEPSLSHMMGELLKNKGYTVLTAGNAAEALVILEKHPVDLMVSDVIMPGEDGYRLASKVRERYPSVQIQMVSGYNNLEHRGGGEKALFEQTLSKPLPSRVLLQRVRELLDQRSS